MDDSFRLPPLTDCWLLSRGFDRASRELMPAQITASNFVALARLGWWWRRLGGRLVFSHSLVWTITFFCVKARKCFLSFFALALAAQSRSGRSRSRRTKWSTRPHCQNSRARRNWPACTCHTGRAHPSTPGSTGGTPSQRSERQGGNCLLDLDTSLWLLYTYLDDAKPRI